MNTTELLASIKRAAGVPAYQDRFSDTDFLALADEETRTVLLPIITNMREDYLVTFTTETVNAGEQFYPIPERAVAQGIRELKFKIISQQYMINLPYVPIEQQYSTFYAAQPTGYNFQGDQIYIVNPPSQNGDLFIWYVAAPSKLVTAAEVAVIASFPAFNQIEVVSVPAGWGAAETLDLVPLRRSSHMPAASDQGATLVGTTITLTSSVWTAGNPVSSYAKVGDHVARAFETDLVQLPTEANDVLVSAVRVRIHGGLGQVGQKREAQEELDRKIRALMDLLTPRNEGEAPVVVQRNGLLNGRFLRRPNIMRG
jgi:hypothetical protein